MSAVDLKTRNLSKETILLGKELQDEDLVEITVSLCKTDGIENHTVMLTKEQAEELEILIDSFKAELDKVETMEETAEIYNDMIISLDELGLIPDEMGVEEAQELATKILHETFNNEIVSKMENALEFDDDENFLCLIAGTLGHHYLFAGCGAQFFLRLTKLNNVLLALLFAFVYLGFLVWDEVNPLALVNIICMGSKDNIAGWEPAKGEIFTIGLNGIKNWLGNFYGRLPLGTYWVWTYYGQFLCVVQFYPGVLGFTGIKIFNEETYETFLLGSALWVKIDYDTPKGFESQQETPISSYAGVQTNTQTSQTNNQLLQLVKTTK